MTLCKHLDFQEQKYTYFQGSMANDKFLDKFNMLCDVVTQLGGYFAEISGIIKEVPLRRRGW